MPIFAAVATQLGNQNLPVDKEVVGVVNECFGMMAGDLVDVLRPTMEAYVGVAVEIVGSCIGLMKDGKVEDGEGFVKEAANFACSVLEIVRKVQGQYPNQKKIFTHTVNKFLLPLVTLRHLISNTTVLTPPLQPRMQELIGKLLKQGLFHHEHIPEFVMVLQQLGTKKAGSGRGKDTMSYPSQLFQKIQEITEEARTVDDALIGRSIGPRKLLVPTALPSPVMEYFPLLCNHFFVSHATARNKPPPSLTFSPEFAFFNYLHDTVSRTSTNLVSQVSSGNTAVAGQLDRALVIMASLLEQLHVHDIYRATNDEVSKNQLEFFGELSRGLVEVAGKISGEYHATIFRSWRILLSLDYTVIQSRMDELWAFIIIPHARAKTDAIELVCALTTTFTKSRQLDAYVTGILEAVRRFGLLDDVDRALEDSSVFSTDSLAEYSTCVSQLLPAQVVSIVKILKQELTRFAVPPLQLQDDTPRKKRKVTSKNAENVGAESSITSSTTAIPKGAHLPTTLLSLTIRHAHIITTQGQRAVFESLADGLHAEFIVPILTQPEGLGKTKSRHLKERGRELVVPALSLHLALMEASDGYWQRNVSTEWVEKLMRVVKAVSAVEPRVALLKNKIALYHVDRTASGMIDPTTEPGCSRIVTGVLEDVGFNVVDTNVEWDRNLAHLDDNNLIVANWCSVMDHIAAVSRLATPEQIGNIVETFVGALEGACSLSDVSSQSSCSLTTITVQLLMSAAFHELRPMRDLCLKTLFARMRTHIEAGFDTSPSTQPHTLQSALMTFLASKPNSTSISALHQTLLSLLPLTTPPVPPSKMSLSSLAKCTSLLASLNTFATSYFTTLERNAVGGLVVAVEWLAGLCEARKKKKERAAAVLRCGAVCRSVGGRFWGGREVKSVLMLSPAFIKWQLESLDTYKELLTADGGKCDKAEMYCKTIVDWTFEMEGLTCRKLLNRIALPPIKAASCTPAEYIMAMMEFLRPVVKRVAKGSAGDVRWITHFVGPVLEWLEGRSAKNSPQAEAPDLTDPICEEFDSFMSKLEPKIVRMFESVLKAAQCKDVGAVGKEEVGYGFEVLRLVVRYRKIKLKDVGEDERKALLVLLDLLGNLMSETVLLVTDIIPDADEDIHRTRVIARCTDFTSTFCEYISFLDHPLGAQSVRHLVRLIWHLIRQSRDVRERSSLLDGTTAALACLVRTASAEQYDVIVACHLDELEKVPGEIAWVADGVRSVECVDGGKVVGLIKAIEALVGTVNEAAGQRCLRRMVPSLVVKLTQILQTTGSLEACTAILRLLTKLCGDKFLKMRTSYLSLIVSAVASLSSPGCHSRLEPSIMTMEVAVDFFDGVYRLLITILRFRREQLMSLIPLFMGIVKTLLFCFRAKPILGRHAYVPRTQSGTAGTSDPFLLDPFPALSSHAPLPPSCADNLSRILAGITRKPTTTSTSSSSGSTATTTLASTKTASSIKPFSKHAPFLVATFVQIQSSSRPLAVDCKAPLMEGIYSMLDLCGDHGREAVLAGLDAHGAGRVVFKGLVADWERYHRYTGKV
ncbi:hypothetical protein HK104_011013 [Borealophlyctis nickersoniae]|nr:hypothetical protein HK104_011013 [Borealophlyctis nickersoniae]